jgi:hypothetical protein
MHKKRCYHEVKRTEEAPTAGGHTRESTVSPEAEGQYHPEAVLVDLSRHIPEADSVVKRRKLTATDSDLHSSDTTAVRAPTPVRRHMNLLPWYKKQKQGAAPPSLSKHHRKYLEEAGAFAELPKSTTDALLPIYVSVLDDLLPIVDGARILRDYSNGLCSVYLVRAICLVVSKYPQAAPFLRLSEDGPLLGPLDFARRVFSGLDAAVKAALEPNCVTKIQILVFMHLHNDGTGGQDRSSAYLSQAINQAWAISLHFPIVGNPDQDQNDMLWWSLRNLDRLNKIVMGAGPFMIDDTDIAIERIVPKNCSYRSQVMAMALILGDLMATATKVYKASLKTTVDDCLTFPTFSELVSGFDFDRFHQSHRSKLACPIFCRRG